MSVVRSARCRSPTHCRGRGAWSAASRSAFRPARRSWARGRMSHTRSPSRRVRPDASLHEEQPSFRNKSVGPQLAQPRRRSRPRRSSARCTAWSLSRSCWTCASAPAAPRSYLRRRLRSATRRASASEASCKAAAVLYHRHLGCILLKMPAVFVRTGSTVGGTSCRYRTSST